MVDFASVRAVHGPVMNRMTRSEIVPHVVFVSFCPYASNRFCATGSALFQLYDIENQNVQQQIVHFRAEFYGFTCHCWRAANSVLGRKISFHAQSILFVRRQQLIMVIYFGLKMVRFGLILIFTIPSLLI